VLVEGLAVWASDGHYRREPIDDWAAVSAASEAYLPLDKLRAGPFYDFQHETAYLEAGSFVKFLIERYGLGTFKELYGQATGKPELDDPLVLRLYGKSYTDLEAEWRNYLADLSPSPEEAEAWRLTVRFFDLMRRYQTGLDPAARNLPDSPTEWTSDTLKIFLHRVDAPVNLVLETAFITAQEHINRADTAGAAALLDDVEAALDAGGELTRPSLQARQAILDLLATQDRAILRADPRAYQATLDPAQAMALNAPMEEALRLPLTSYWQEITRLDVADDGRSAEGIVLVHSHIAPAAGGDFAEAGRLFAVRFKLRDRWLLSSREPLKPELVMPSAPEPVACFALGLAWSVANTHYALCR
jgi:hypothetical protein